MPKLTDLTDEELLKLAQESGLESNKEPTSNLQSLSDEELLALADQTGVSTQPKKAEPIVTSAESALRGVAQGVTVGFADEIAGALESTLSDKPYEQARNESRQAFAQAQQANPNAYLMGEIAGGVGTTVATGGISAGYRGAAIVGGLAGIGFSNRTGSALLKDAAIGSAFGIAGEKVAKGVGRYIQKMFKNSSPVTKETFEALGETTRPENVKFEANLMKDAFNGRYGSADDWIASAEFGARVQKELDETPRFIKSIFSDKKKQLGGQIQAITEDLPVKEVDVSEIVDGFKSSLKESLRQTGPDKGAMKIIQKEILDNLDNGTFGVAIDEAPLNINSMSPMQATNFKRAIQEIIYADTDSEGLVNMIKKSPRANSILNEFANSITEMANNLDQTGSLREVNRQYSQLLQAENLIPKRADSAKLLRLQDAVSPTKAGAEMREFTQLLEGVDPEFKAMLIKEVNPRLSAYKLHQAASFQGGAVSTAFRAKAGAQAGSGFGPVGETAGLIVGAGEAAMVNTANVIAKARKSFKVPRNLADIFANSDIIASKLSQVSPTLAITFNDMVADGDENGVEEIVKTLMQSPEAQNQFEEGFGFEGKAVTPEEVQQARGQIMASQIPLSQKIQAINSLEADGTIPTPEELAPRIRPEVRTKRELSLENLEKVKLAEKGLR